MQRFFEPYSNADELYSKLKKLTQQEQLDFACHYLEHSVDITRIEDGVASHLILTGGPDLIKAYLKDNTHQLANLLRHFSDYSEEELLKILFNDANLFQGLFFDSRVMASIRLIANDLPPRFVKKCLIQLYQNPSHMGTFLQSNVENVYLVLKFAPELKKITLEHLIRDLNWCRHSFNSLDSILEILGDSPEQLQAIFDRLCIDRQWQFTLFTQQGFIPTFTRLLTLFPNQQQKIIPLFSNWVGWLPDLMPFTTEEELHVFIQAVPILAEQAQAVYRNYLPPRPVPKVKNNLSVEQQINELISSAAEKNDLGFIQEILEKDDFAEWLLLSDDLIALNSFHYLFSDDVGKKIVKRFLSLPNVFHNATRFALICKGMPEIVSIIPESKEALHKLFGFEHGVSNLLQFLNLHADQPELKNTLIRRVLSYPDMAASMLFSTIEYKKFCELVDNDIAMMEAAAAIREPVIKKMNEIVSRNNFPRVLQVLDLDKTLVDDTSGTLERLPQDLKLAERPEEVIHHLERFQDIHTRFPNVISTIATYGVNKHRAKKVLLAIGGSQPENRTAAIYTPDLMKFHANSHQVQRIVQHHKTTLGENCLSDIEMTCKDLRIDPHAFLKGLVDCIEACAKDAASDRYDYIGKCVHVLLFLIAEFTRENYQTEVVPVVFMDDDRFMLEGMVEKLNGCIPIMSKHLNIKIPLARVYPIKARPTSDLNGKKIIDGSDQLVQKIESVVLDQLAQAHLSCEDRAELKNIAPLLKRKALSEIKVFTESKSVVEEKSSILSHPPSLQEWAESGLSHLEQITIFRQLEKIQQYATDLKSCKDLLERRQYLLTHPEPNNELQLLALLFEEMFQITGKYPYPNQILTLLAYLSAPNGRRIGEIQTGEGKSLILAILAAYLALVRKEKVHIVPPSAYLSERDYKQFKAFYEKVGVSVAFDGLASSKYLPTSLYQTSSVIYTTVDAAALRIGEEEKTDLSDRHLILDEADRYFLDTVGDTNKKTHPGLMYSPALLKLFWDYGNSHEIISLQNVIDFLKREGYVPLDCKDESCSPFKMTQNELQHMVDALNAARTMQVSVDYVILKNQIKVYKTNGSPQYALFLNYFLRLKENLTLKNREDLISSSVPNYEFLCSYKTIWGATGTAGSVEEKAYLTQKFDLSFFTAPLNFARNLTSKVEDHLILEDETTWRLTIVDQVLKQAATRPVLLLCNTLAEAEELALMEFKKLNRPVFILDHAKTTDEIAEILKNAVPGAIFIGTHPAPRGLDIQISDEVSKAGGLAVFATGYPTVERDVRQAQGRAARQGKAGSFQFILCREHLRRRTSVAGDVLNELKCQNESISRHKMQLNDSYIALLETLRLADQFYKSLPLTAIQDDHNKRFALNLNYSLVNAEDIWAKLYTEVDLVVEQFQLEIQQKQFALTLSKTDLEQMNDALRQRVGRLINEFWSQARMDIAVHRPGLNASQWIQEKASLIPRSLELISLLTPLNEVSLDSTVSLISTIRHKLSEGHRLCADDKSSSTHIRLATHLYEEVTLMISRLDADNLSWSENLQLYLLFYDLYDLNKKLERLPTAILKDNDFLSDSYKHIFYLERLFRSHIEPLLEEDNRSEKWAVMQAILAPLENRITNEVLNEMTVKTLKSYVKMVAENKELIINPVPGVEQTLTLIQNTLSSPEFCDYYRSNPYPFGSQEEINYLRHEVLPTLLNSIKQKSAEIFGLFPPVNKRENLFSSLSFRAV